MKEITFLKQIVIEWNLIRMNDLSLFSKPRTYSDIRICFKINKIHLKLMKF
jgi:hypothetical protein